MKFKAFLSGLFYALICLPVVGMAVEKNGDGGELNVAISNIRSDAGVIRVALYNSKQTYEAKDPSGSMAYRRAQLPIKQGEAVWKVQGLVYGMYGIKLFHDENNSGKLTKSMVGRPTEGIGFSNNPKVSSHAPTFNEVKFAVNQPKTTINIKMINP